MEGNRQQESLAFLYASVSDIQATIRQLDTKANALLVVLTLILANINHIAAAVGYVQSHRSAPLLWNTLAGIDGLSWLLATWLSYRTLNAISNPAQQITTENGARGTFYNAGNFATIPLFSLLFGSASPVEKPTLALHIKRLPQSQDELVAEMAFEQLKVAYIRDVKSLRLRWAFKCAMLAVLITVSFWFYGLVIGADLVATGKP